MGTRSLTVFNDRDGKEIVVLYRQYDGNPKGHGVDLCEFLSGIEIVNGIGQTDRRLANGMGCLSAQVVAHFKTEVGAFYLYAAGTRDVCEEYIYTVENIDGKPFVTCEEVVYQGQNKVLYHDTAEKVLELIGLEANE